MEKYQYFLKEIGTLGNSYSSILEDDTLCYLGLSFWNWDEIEYGLSLLDEWDVPKHLIPFYGDWHDLYCIDTKSDEIVYINDDRKILWRWASIQKFKDSLSKEELEPSENLEITSFKVSSKLAEKAREFNKKNT